MSEPYLVFLSKIDRKSELFHNCLSALLSVDPIKWPKKRILYAIDVLHYDALIYTDGAVLIAAACFNPDQAEKAVRVFLIFVSPAYRGKGFGKFIVAELLKWAFEQKYKKAQVGLGKNPATTAILQCLAQKKEAFGLAFIEIINPGTGLVIFQFQGA